MERRNLLKLLGIAGVAAVAPKLVLPALSTKLAEPERKIFIPPASGWLPGATLIEDWGTWSSYGGITRYVSPTLIEGNWSSFSGIIRYVSPPMWELSTWIMADSAVEYHYKFVGSGQPPDMRGSSSTRSSQISSHFQVEQL